MSNAKTAGVIGIDPGLSGGIAFVPYHNQDEHVYARAMPAVKAAGTKSELSMPTIIEVLESLMRRHTVVVAVVEKVSAMPKQGVTSTFTFGKGYGEIQGILAALRIPYQLVTPQAWKKAVLYGTLKDKTAAISYCQMMYPRVSLLATERSKMPHDGMADALCLATYGITTIRPPE